MHRKISWNSRWWKLAFSFNEFPITLIRFQMKCNESLKNFFIAKENQFERRTSTAFWDARLLAKRKLHKSKRQVQWRCWCVTKAAKLHANWTFFSANIVQPNSMVVESESEAAQTQPSPSPSIAANNTKRLSQIKLQPFASYNCVSSVAGIPVEVGDLVSCYVSPVISMKHISLKHEWDVEIVM